MKKISNQIDFNNYKKIFCSAFSKFETNSNINAYKSNFHNFYMQVKTTTEANLKDVIIEEEKNNDMSNFLKTRKEFINLKQLEKTQKIFDSTMDLIEKEPTFLENFDVTKVSFPF